MPADDDDRCCSAVLQQYRGGQVKVKYAEKLFRIGVVLLRHVDVTFMDVDGR